MKMLLTAEFASAESIPDAVRALAAAGFSGGKIEIFSDRPVDLPEGVLAKRSHISLAAVAGAAINGALATAFIFFTERNYALVTGGMPLTSWWPTGVISYEMAMAGAVAGIIAAFLWEGRLLFRSKARAPVRLKEGAAFVEVHCDANSMPDAAATLKVAGATAVTEVER